jgi:hypothetical protein
MDLLDKRMEFLEQKLVEILKEIREIKELKLKKIENKTT